MNLFGKNKKDEGENSSSPVVSEKTKSSASFLKKTVSKIGGLFQSKKIGEDLTAEPMSNAEYLGEIYKLMVQNHDDIKLERQQTDNRREEEDSEDQKRHSEIIKALTLRRRPKPKRVIRRERKAEEQAKAPSTPSMPGKPGKPSAPSKPAEPSKPPSKPAEPSKPAQKPAETKPAQPSKPAEPTKPAETRPAQKPAEPTKPAQKPAETKPAEQAKPKTAEPVKEAPKQPPAKPAEPVKPTEAPKPPTPALKPAAPKTPPSATKIPKGMSSAVGPVLAALTSAGITNVYAQRALLANVEKETGGNKLEEDVARYKSTSNERIREVFGSRVKNLSDEELNKVKQDPYKFGELVYGKNTKIGQSMGNTEEGDGYKYRGRGYIQITGKNNYKSYSSVAGVDLLKNPDALLQPDIAAKVAAEYIKRTGGKKGLEFANQQEANRAITQAIGGSKLNLDKGYGAELLNKVEKNSKNYSDVGTGSQIDQVSKDNKDMKSQEKSSPPPIQQNTTNVNNTTESSAAPAVNDRPKHDRK
jgi:predicted chitinase